MLNSDSWTVRLPSGFRSFRWFISAALFCLAAARERVACGSRYARPWFCELYHTRKNLCFCLELSFPFRELCVRSFSFFGFCFVSRERPVPLWLCRLLFL